MPGELPNIVSGRVANVLNLNGPTSSPMPPAPPVWRPSKPPSKCSPSTKSMPFYRAAARRNMGIGSFVKFCKIGAERHRHTSVLAQAQTASSWAKGGRLPLKRLEDAEHLGDTATRLRRHSRRRRSSSDGKGQRYHRPNPIGREISNATRLGQRRTRSGRRRTHRSTRHQHRWSVTPCRTISR